jgi:predicted nuclease of predicted toxin-antitoxin system
MKLLLDECIDQRLAREILDHEVKTVPEMGWANLKNGQLLNLAQHEFDVFITVDRNLPHQQNLPKFNIVVVVLRSPTNRLADLKKLVPMLLEKIRSAPVGQATLVSN